MRAVLFDDLPSPPCGAGSESSTVLPDGRILTCPIAVDSDWAPVGELDDSTISEVRVGSRAWVAGTSGTEGGCLYAYMERLWGEDGFHSVCDIVKETIDTVLRIEDDVNELISDGVVSIEELTIPSTIIRWR